MCVNAFALNADFASYVNDCADIEPPSAPLPSNTIVYSFVRPLALSVPLLPGVADNSALGSALADDSTVGSGEDDGAGVSSARTLMPLNSISADKKAAVNL